MDYSLLGNNVLKDHSWPTFNDPLHAVPTESKSGPPRRLRYDVPVLVSKPKKKLARRQHIIPSWYLDNFCDGSGKLYVYERGKDVRAGVSRNECLQRDFYEFDLAGRKTSNDYEDWLSRIEGNAKAIFPKIVANDHLRPKEAAIWSYFVASLFYRTRKVCSQISSLMLSKLRAETQTEEFLREVQYAAFKKGELYELADLRQRVDAFQTKFERSPFYHITGLPRHTHVLAGTIIRKNWHVVSAPAGKLVPTSDCPVVIVERKEQSWELGAGFAKDNVIAFLPLTPGRLFIAASASFGFKPIVPEVAADAFRLATIRFAPRNVYSDQETEELKNLVDLEINQIEFGKNAFT